MPTQRTSHRAATACIVAALCALGAWRSACAGGVAATRHGVDASAFTFPPQNAAGLVVCDDGVDVTSAAYAARRRFPEPLRLVPRSLGGPRWWKTRVPYGTVAIDPARGRLEFFGGYDGPVRLIRRVRLPHGKPIGLARRGDHLFFMTDSNMTGLLVADVSDPRRPRVVATADKGGAWTNGIAMVGSVVYAAVSGVLYAWDVSNPLEPRPRPTVQFDGRAIAAHGSTLWFTKGRNELGRLDITAGAAMKPQPALTIPGAQGLGAPCFLGDKLLVEVRFPPGSPGGQEADTPLKTVTLDLKEGLGEDPKPKWVPEVHILRIGEGAELVPLVRWRTSGLGRLAGAQVIGGKPMVLLRGSRGGLAFVDASDVAAPRVVTIAGELTGSFAIDGDRLYLARRSPCRQDGGLFVYDISDLARPRRLGSVITPDRRVMDERSGWRVRLAAGRWVYVTDPIYGILIIDVQDPARPRIVGGLHEAGEWRCMAVTASRVFIGGDPGGLAIVDNRVPGRAGRVGSFMPGPVLGVAGRGTVAFVANGGGLRIVETADPARPVELGSIGWLDEASMVTLHGHLAFVASHGGRGNVVDVRDLRRPRRLGRFRTKRPVGLDAADGHLYVADGSEGLVVFDVRDPRRPLRVSATAREGSSRFQGVHVAGSHAFLSRQDGLVIVDVSDPTRPTVVGDSEQGRGGTVAGQYIYGCAYYGEHNLFVTDVGELAEPRLVARHDPGRYSYATDIGFRGGLVYLTSLPYLSIFCAPVSGQVPAGRVTVAPLP